MKKLLLFSTSICLIFGSCRSSKNWTSENFSKQVFSILEDQRTQFFYEKTKIPLAVIQELSKFREREFLIANPNEPFNKSDALNELPQNRLILFAKRGKECLLICESGGRSLLVKVDFFVLKNRKMRQIWVGMFDQMPEPDIEKIKLRLRAGEFGIGEGERFSK